MNQKHKKRLAVLMAIMLAGMLMAGCHGKKARPDFVMPDSFDTSREYTVTFWAKNDTNKYQVRIYEQAIESFTALYPNIHVEMKLYTDYAKIYNDVITNIATDTTPNVCITYPDHIATYLTGSNTVVPLDELFGDAAYGLGGSELTFESVQQQEIEPKFLQECKFDGHYYAIPFMRSTEACYVNANYVRALGYTLPEVLSWEFVWEVSEAALAKNSAGKYALNNGDVMIPFIYKSTDNMMIQSLYQLDGGYSTADGKIELFNDTTRKILADVAVHAKSGAFSTFKISSYPANFLNAGQCVFAVDSTAGATWMGSGAPLLDISQDKVVQFTTAVYPVPQYDAAHPMMISQGPSICLFNKADPQEVLASWLFAQYLLTNEIQIPYASSEGYVPVTRKAQQSQAYTEYLAREGADTEHYSVKIQAAKLFLDNIEHTFVTPVFNGSAALRTAAGTLIENITKAARRGQETDQEAITQMFEDVTKLYHLDQIGAGAKH